MSTGATATILLPGYDTRRFLARGRWLSGKHSVEVEISVSRPAGSAEIGFVAEAFTRLKENYGEGYAWTLAPVATC